MASLIDEDVIEAAFWAFDLARKRTGAERDAFKEQMRAVLRAHLASLLRDLEKAEVYLTAYTTGFDPPGGQTRAHAFKRTLTDRLSSYRQTGAP